jgi:hypothetical protein
MKMKGYGIAGFLLGLVGVYATVYVARQAWDSGDSGFSGNRSIGRRGSLRRR